MKWYEILKVARTIKDISLRDVEKATCISNAYLSQIETGKINEPGFFLMSKLLKFYNVQHRLIIDAQILEANSPTDDDSPLATTNREKEIG